MKLDEFLNKKVVVKQVKGGLKLNERQKANLIGLGLRKIGSSATLQCDNSVLGMIRKVSHILNISLVN